jgi:hypothetical protein
MKAARAIAAVCLTVGLVDACVLIDREPNTPRVSNLTDEPVTLSIERDGVTTPLSTIKGGITIDLNPFNGTCTDGTLVAIGPGGEEVARRTEPLCPEEAWSIGP